MKKLLLTGSSGFVGTTMMKFQHGEGSDDNDWEIIPLPGSIDICNQSNLEDFINGIQPDYVIHLAAQTFVPRSFSNPRETYEINFMGTYNLLESLKKSNFTGKVLYVSTSEVYGNISENNLPITEDCTTEPKNPYAVSKLAVELMCQQMTLSGDLEVVIVRPFNHIGAGQDRRFSISDFSFHLVDMWKNNSPRILHVGDVEVSRDFIDVRDVVRAYFYLLDSATPGKVYNVCSGIERSIRSVILQMIKIVDLDVDIIVDNDRLRVVDQRRIVGNCDLIKKDTDWMQTYSFSQTLDGLINYWKERL